MHAVGENAEDLAEETDLHFDNISIETRKSNKQTALYLDSVTVENNGKSNEQAYIEGRG